MKLRFSIPLLGTALLFSSCGPESMLNPTQVVPPQPVIPIGPETTFVNDVRGARIDYKDKNGECVYKLSKIGTYTFTSISRKGQSSAEKQGLYIYKQTGKKTGELIFDLSKTWKLTFVSTHRAIAKMDGDPKAYTFEFEWQ